MDAKIKLTVNGMQKDVTTDPNRSLLDVLREELQLLVHDGGVEGGGQVDRDD